MPLSANDQLLLYHACIGNDQGVRDLLRAGANVNAQFEENGVTALHAASASGHVEVVRELLRNNTVDVNLRTVGGSAAIHMASEDGHVEVVRELLRNSTVNVNLRSVSGSTALIYASQNGHVEVVRELLRNNTVNANLQRNDGGTALYMASQNGHLEVVRVLLQSNKVDVNHQPPDGSSALLIASQNGHEEVVRELLQNDAVEVNLQSTTGATALYMASQLGRWEVVGLLLQNDKVEVNHQLTDGSTALMIASQNGYESVVRELLQSSAVNVNLRSTNGATALYMASQSGRLEVVRLLLENNELDMNLQCLDGSTALDIALKNQNDDVARLLERRMEEERNRLMEEEQKRREQDERKHQTDAELQQGMIKKRRRQEVMDTMAIGSGAEDRVTDDLPLHNTNSPSSDDAKIEEDRSKLLHVMNTSSADPEELSLEYIERCIKKDQKLGSGAFGDVFLAEDSLLKKKFAVKMIRPTDSNEAAIKEIRRSFQTELSTLKRFQHPNIIALYGYSLNVNSTQQCLVYEYATNGSLAGFFVDDGSRARLSAATRLSIMFELVRAVHFLHTGGCKVKGKGWKVFHRDIKSANICLADDFTPRLIDCGLAKFVPDDNSNATPGPLTVSLRSNTVGLAFGTPGYMCPEYLRKKGRGLPCPYIAAFDVFSIGVVLVELILGCLNGGQLIRNDPQRHDIFGMYVQDERGRLVVDGLEKLLLNADRTIIWNPVSLDLVCKAAMQCMAPVSEDRLSTKVLLNKLGDAILSNTNVGLQHPAVASAVDSGPYCLICNEYRTDIKCSEGHALCTACIVDKLVDYSGCQLSCLIKECSSKLQDNDLYGRIPVEMYNRYFKKPS
ncbi:serine/threonine kinase [Fragilaria crotonensis]|nr:serine/threonine kinase [Fragilaria crotonensis]